MMPFDLLCSTALTSSNGGARQAARASFSLSPRLSLSLPARSPYCAARISMASRRSSICLSRRLCPVLTSASTPSPQPPRPSTSAPLLPTPRASRMRKGGGSRTAGTNPSMRTRPRAQSSKSLVIQIYLSFLSLFQFLAESKFFRTSIYESPPPPSPRAPWPQPACRRRRAAAAPSPPARRMERSNGDSLVITRWQSLVGNYSVGWKMGKRDTREQEGKTTWAL